MRDIPYYVRNALNDWETLAFVAYDWYEKMGRILVGIDQDDADPAGAKLIAVLYEFEAGKPDPVTAKLLAEYDPDTEVIVQFIDKTKHIRTQRLRAGSGAQHPKKIFFFEMLRRINEEPETIDLLDLPHWFVEALEKLEAARKTA